MHHNYEPYEAAEKQFDDSILPHHSLTSVTSKAINGMAAYAVIVQRRQNRGKYVLGQLLGVPVFVLVIIYLILH